MTTIEALGDIGSFVSGLAAVVLAIAAIIGGSAGLGDWRAKQRAQRDVAAEEANNLRLNRMRLNHGWSPHGVDSFGVTLVTDPAEFAVAQKELTSGGPTEYVVMRVTSGGNGGDRLRRLIQRDGFVARVPNDGEIEAVEAGLEVLGVMSRRRVMERATAK
ncbi:hypothetical protein ACFQY4_35385 [Catellatospora bangladeshensis]|nr:hypothetical protein [Catellatospora bangladeshensis]